MLVMEGLWAQLHDLQVEVSTWNPENSQKMFPCGKVLRKANFKLVIWKAFTEIMWRNPM